jgi:hypothetical protein
MKSWHLQQTNNTNPILSGSPPKYKDCDVLRILLTERMYAASDEKFSGKVLNQLSEISLPVG